MANRERKWQAGPLPRGAEDWVPPTADEIRKRSQVTDETLAEALDWIRRNFPAIADRLEGKPRG